MTLSKVTLVALCAALGLAACKPAGPPPDIVKTQREALQKAKNVDEAQQKAVEEQRKAVDDATK